jgi:hypothetical protein
MCVYPIIEVLLVLYGYVMVIIILFEHQHSLLYDIVKIFTLY